MPCACGQCDEMVLTPNRWGNPVRYVVGHQNKIAKNRERGNRYGTGKYEHLRGVMIECGCKCGGKIPAYDFEKRRHRKFVRGHQWIGRASPKRGRNIKNYDELKQCECGCESWMPRYNKHSGVENHFIQGHHLIGKTLTIEHREKLSESVSKSMPIRMRRKRSVPTYYKGQLYDGWHEAAYALWLDEQGYHYKYLPAKIPFYWSDGSRHNYHPDFWIEEFQRYDEIKGTLHDDEAEKMTLVRKSNPRLNIQILTSRELYALGIEYKENPMLHPTRPIRFISAARKDKKKESGNETV